MCNNIADRGGMGLQGAGKVLPHASHPIGNLPALRIEYIELPCDMAVFDFPKSNDNAREALIKVPDGSILLRSEKPITVAIALYLLERAKSRVLLSLEGLDGADHEPR